ncbi:hypothetical protein LTR56_018736 [Elasticomyces elasticus]|nr:hypothetical protein LTR56_018736 [Elasticomyces elasticus]KAK3635963.1 hypothetical protein LTR22_018956 [Elasticomyces elasticus]KAK4911962.1 hypothetical protein LTR49_019524 [Elasticomyces elasticus]KAK5751498.1 hypothetical protein LTS12_018421 [Elasticomyces elasticus]
MPIDHTSVTVPLNKFDAFKTFMLAALQPLGTRVLMVFSQYNSIGLGESLPYFWIQGLELDDAEEAVALKMLQKTHLAFTADSQDQVQESYEAALKAGATDNGVPGQRPQYGEKYYAAFVTEPLFGFNLEVVCRK